MLNLAENKSVQFLIEKFQFLSVKIIHSVNSQNADCK